MSRPARPRAQPLPRAVVVAGVGLPVLVLLAVFIGRLSADETDEPTGEFATAVAAAYEQTNPELLALADTLSRWTTGDATDEALTGALDGAEATLPEARRAVAELDEPGGAAPAKALFVATADLYGIVVDVLRQALRVEDDAEELALLARRVRTIADRLYDRGRAIVAPSSDDTTDITVVRSAPVPDWAADGLASELDAGRDLDRDALDQRDDEPGRRRALRLLVLAEAERSTALGLADIAATLGEIATSIDEG